MANIDLHIHTTASDGTLSPEEIVDLAIETGLSTIAITDHDTIYGIERAVKYAEGKNIRVIPGVEISSNFDGREVHILGYNIDYNSPVLLKTLEILSYIRDSRTEKMVRLHQKDGIDISMDALYEMFPQAVITRANMAEYFVRKGLAGNKYEAFEKYLDDETKYYVPKNRIAAEDAINVIKEADGIPVMAHPVIYSLKTADDYENLFKRAKEMGIEGIEAVYSNNRPGDSEMFKQLAGKIGLFTTGGSDFHGSPKPKIKLGLGMYNDDSYEKFAVDESVLKYLDK